MFALVLDSGHNYIGSEHWLLGLLREGEGMAASVLQHLGADSNNIRNQASIATFSSLLFYDFAKSEGMINLGK